MKGYVAGKSTRVRKATAVAILFHLVGLIGLLFFDRALFLLATPGNLLLMGVLLIWTQAGRNRFFYLFVVSCLLLGLLVEIIGVRTSFLFGHYSYGKMMGFELFTTPLIVGVNWFIVIYCSAASMYWLKRNSLSVAWIVGGGALLATFYDWLMEPVASKLGYWRWAGDGITPLYNYICWLIISALLLYFFHWAKFEKPNKFAAGLMLIQLLFFSILRISL